MDGTRWNCDMATTCIMRSALKQWPSLQIMALNSTLLLLTMPIFFRGPLLVSWLMMCLQLWLYGFHHPFGRWLVDHATAWPEVTLLKVSGPLRSGGETIWPVPKAHGGGGLHLVNSLEFDHFHHCRLSASCLINFCYGKGLTRAEKWLQQHYVTSVENVDMTSVKSLALFAHQHRVTSGEKPGNDI